MDSTGPQLEPANTEEADDGVAALYAVQPKENPNEEDHAERSANLWADPKLRQLKKAATKPTKSGEESKKHSKETTDAKRMLEESRGSKSLPRSGSAASLGPGDAPVSKRTSLRVHGTDIVDMHAKQIAGHRPWLPQVGSSADRYEGFKHPESALSAKARNPDLQKRQDEKAGNRVQWRSTMDRSLKRLMMDVELAQDPSLGSRAHASSCNHLDRVHDWYITHGKKDARKAAAGQSFLRYNPQDPVMPGSLRAPPLRFENPLGVGVAGGISTLPGGFKRGDLRGSLSEPALHGSEVPSPTASHGRRPTSGGLI
jgi:hypothetical protein